MEQIKAVICIWKSQYKFKLIKKTSNNHNELRTFAESLVTKNEKVFAILKCNTVTEFIDYGYKK